MITKIRLGILFLLAIIVAGCQGGFPEIKPIGIMEGYIKDIITEEPVFEAYVKLQRVEFVTDSSGYFPLYRKDVKTESDAYIVPNEAGDVYSITANNYYTKTGTSKFSYGQKNLMGYITPKPKYKDFNNPSKGYTGFIVSGTVYSERGKLSGATVVVNSLFSGSPSKQETDANGMFIFNDVSQGKIAGGKINIYIYKDGYNAASKIIDLNSDWTDDQIKLTENGDKKYGDIKGQVTGFGDEQCSYSKVSWGQLGSSTYQFNITDMDGNYILYGIPQGDTEISVKSPGFYESSPGSSNQIHVTAGAIAIHNVKMNYIKGSVE